MGARQYADLDPDRPHFIEPASIEADAALEHFAPQHLLLELLENLLRLELPLDFSFRDRRDELFQDFIDAIVVLELSANAHRFGERHEHLLLDLAIEVVPDLAFRDLHFRRAGLAGQFVDGRDDPLDGGVRGFERLNHLLFRHLLRACLDHHDRVVAAGDDEIELALLALLERGVDQILTVEEADPHAGNRLREWNVGQRQRR